MTEEKDDNTVFIGDKPFMNYVNGVAVQFQKPNASQVIIKARGKFISRAVDVAEVITKKYLESEKIKVKDIKIGSEEFVNKEGKKVKVSIIEIVLGRK